MKPDWRGGRTTQGRAMASALSPVESFVALMSARHAEALLLHAGDRALLLSGADQTPLPGTMMTAAQMELMLASIAGEREIDPDRPFEHRLTQAFPDDGDLLVTAIRTDDDLWMELRRLPPSAAMTASVPPAGEPTGENGIQFDAWIRRARELGAS